MLILVALLGAFIAGIGVVCFVNTEILKRAVTEFWKRSDALYLAVGFRLVSGGIVVAAAPQSRYPTLLGFLGVLFLLTAAFIPLIGRHRLNAMVEWWSYQSPAVVRLWSMIALLLGAFLVYASV